MSKNLTCLFLLLSSALIQAQSPDNGLSDAERAFAAHSVAHGRKSAFLAFADTNSIMFQNGKPVRTHQLWSSMKNETLTGILNWAPDYVEISGDGSFGFTTGPWTFHPKSIQDTPTSVGHFMTVWHRTREKKWMFMIDLGIDYPKPAPVTQIQYGMTANTTGPNKPTLKEVMNLEKAFIELYRSQGRTAYDSFLSDRSRLYRNGSYPAIISDDRRKMLDSLPRNIAYTVIDGAVAPTGELAYVYGSIRYNGKKENYLRIWRREWKGWKLALEVMR